jgi:hypothetical protein
VVHVVGVLLHAAYARHLTSQLHTAAIAETYRELSEKTPACTPPSSACRSGSV